MTYSISDELISAWLDDELTATEAQLVQAAIDTDSDVARRVNELRVLSGVFKSLPVEPVPRGFHQLVIEATQATVREPATSVPAAGRRVGRRWWIPVGMVASAALLLVTLKWNDDIGQDRFAYDTTSADESSGVRNISAARSIAPPPPQLVASDFEMDDDLSFVDPASEIVAGPPELMRRTFDPSQLKFERSLTDVDVGDVIEAIDQTGDTVSVVKLTVVDRSASVGRLEVLLAVHPGSSVGSATGGMIMIEALPEQLAKCFKKLQEEDLLEEILVASDSVDYDDVPETEFAVAARSQAGFGAPEIASKAFTAGLDSASGAMMKADVAVRQRAVAGIGSLPEAAAESNDSGSNDAKVAIPAEPAIPGKQQSPVRLLIVLEPPADSAASEGSGSIIDFRAVYGHLG